MSEYTSCPVCFETFDELEHLPLILSCGHTICKSSLRSIVESSAHLLCPLDRKVEARPISKLPRNILILQIADQSRTTHTGEVCCRTHGSRLAEFRCEDCQATYCSKCIVKEHQHHQLQEIDSECGEWQKKLQKTCQEVQEDYQLCEKAYDLAVSHHSLVLQDETRLKERLKSDFEALRQILTQKEEDLKRIISQKCLEKLTEMNVRKNELEEEFRLMTESLQLVRRYQGLSGLSSEELKSALQDIASKRHFLSSSKMSLPSSPSPSLTLNIDSLQSAISGLDWRPKVVRDLGVGPILSGEDRRREGNRVLSPESDEEEEGSERVQCTYCNRPFSVDRIHIHIEACRKITHRRVQPMDFSQRRRAAFK